MSEEWTAYDNKSLRLSWGQGYFEVDFSTKCVVTYDALYRGKVVNFEKDTMLRRDIIGYPRARLILET